jgi:hypothetical protein
VVVSVAHSDMHMILTTHSVVLVTRSCGCCQGDSRCIQYHAQGIFQEETVWRAHFACVSCIRTVCHTMMSLLADAQQLCV